MERVYNSAVEFLSYKQGVIGSNPIRPNVFNIFFKNFLKTFFFFCFQNIPHFSMALKHASFRFATTVPFVYKICHYCITTFGGNAEKMVCSNAVMASWGNRQFFTESLSFLLKGKKLRQVRS